MSWLHSIVEMNFLLLTLTVEQFDRFHRFFFIWNFKKQQKFQLLIIMRTSHFQFSIYVGSVVVSTLDSMSSLNKTLTRGWLQ